MASRTRSRRWTRAAAAAIAAALLAALLATPVQARTSRLAEGSVGTFAVSGAENPIPVAVDHANGDVYAFDIGSSGEEASDVVVRFDSTGAPKDFTAGPDAGTNRLTGLRKLGFFARPDIAIDDSGGPLDGTVYVAVPAGGPATPGEVKAFARSGEPVGVIDGAAFGGFNSASRGICGVAVDPSDGALYVGGGEYTWRYAPESPVGALDEADFAVTGIQRSGCMPAASSGHFYGSHSSGKELFRYATADFGPASEDEIGLLSFPKAEGELIDGPVPNVSDGVTGVDIDRTTGDLYVNEGSRVAVFDSAGALRYRFGHASESGIDSLGIAVRSAASGPAQKVYVADGQTGGGELDVYGAPTAVPTYTHFDVAGVGPDGSAESSFAEIRQIAFDAPAGRLYALDTRLAGAEGSVLGVYGFDAGSPPSYEPLAAFGPLDTGIPRTSGDRSGVAVDGTALGSAGNVYIASQATGLLYGHDSTGAPLPGFPLDPAVAPGAPDGSPKDLCGVAVDSAGNVWISNAESERILGYTSGGAYLSSVDTSARGAPCAIAFDGEDALYAAIEKRESTTAGVWKLDPASGYTAATKVAEGEPDGIAVDPASDRLYVANEKSVDGFTVNWVDEYEADGELVDEFALGIPAASFEGVAVDPASGNVHLGDAGAKLVRVVGPGLLLPELRPDGAEAVANATATLTGVVGSQGVSLTECRFEYVTEAAFRVSGFADLGSGGSAPCDPEAGAIPADLEDHDVAAAIGGLARNTGYRFRLVAANAEGASESEDAGFETAGPPEVETVGSPVRTAATARLEGRLDPRNAAATFHFEYGAQGPCDSNPCESTEPVSAGSGGEVRLVSHSVAGLEPDTAYHYRLVADNGNPDGPAFGGDATVRTRASDSPLSHGRYPGPPGSDRAWEQVSLPESGGNPVSAGYAFSDDGNRAIYQIPGGTPITDSGSAFNQLFAERSASGWHSRQILPPRGDVVGPNWPPPFADPTLSRLFALNANVTSGERAFWLLRAEGAPTKLYEGGEEYGGFFMASDDLSRGVVALKGDVDPAHPAPAETQNLYDVGSGAPQLASLLPGDAVAQCGVGGSVPAFGLQDNQARRTDDWLSGDGSLLVFPSRGDDCGGESQLYLRDIEAAETVAVSGVPVSGPACGAAFVKGTPGAVFFWTQARLAAEDSAPGDCLGAKEGDVYRYDVASEALECVTCLVPGLAADVSLSKGSSLGGAATVAVAEDGSRLYFRSPNRLLAGAAAPGAYRVAVGSGDLAYVAPLAEGDAVGDHLREGNAVTPDGSVLTFRSSSPKLNPVGGADNGATRQYYRYDDRDRSLVCVSCPQDGSPAGAPASDHDGAAISSQVGPNSDPLSDAGDFAFTTPLALVSADQNTAGPGQAPYVGNDLYEWRDGRLLLVSDGIAAWPSPSLSPLASGVSPDGEDVYFTASAQLTPDAPDAYNRLYDARVGGGFDFPEAERPCPLEACQGIPAGVPEGPTPATAGYVGPGNVRDADRQARRCARVGRQARRLNARARRLRAGAARARAAAHSRVLRRRAAKAAHKAKRRAAAAQRCRARLARARRRAGR